MDLGRRLPLLVVVLLTLGLSACRGCRPPPPPAGPGSGEGPGGSVDLQIEFYGGFAYVPTLAENRFEVAYLESTSVSDCTVKQLGTDLQVVEGRIVEPANHDGSGRFNLERAVVTFPALESASIPLVVPRGQRPTTPPFKPANPSNAAEWEDLKWVPNVREELKSSLNPDWRTLVNGRLVLRGGRVKGLHPSDVVVRDSEFEFRRKNGTPAFRQAITDRVQYDVRLPARQVELLLSGATSKTTRIVVAPESPGRPVILKVIGKHTEHTGEPLPIGSEIRDYCAFYQLLQPIPPSTDWLLPTYLGNSAPAGTGKGQPSPGPFCPGDFF